MKGQGLLFVQDFFIYSHFAWRTKTAMVDIVQTHLRISDWMFKVTRVSHRLAKT